VAGEPAAPYTFAEKHYNSQPSLNGRPGSSKRGPEPLTNTLGKTSAESTDMFLILGAVVNLGCTVWFYLRARKRLATWSSAKGTIAAMEQHNGDTGESPVVTFVDNNGRRHEFTNYMGGSNWYRRDSRVHVLYDPEQPGRAQINDWTSIWGITAIGVFTGTLFSLFSVFGAAFLE